MITVSTKLLSSTIVFNIDKKCFLRSKWALWFVFLNDFWRTTLKKKTHSGARCESSLTSITSLMEKPDILHKINDFIHKDTKYNTLDVKTSSELFTVCLWSHSVSRLEWNAGRKSVSSFPLNTAPARVQEPAPLRWKQNRDWSMNYFNVEFLF